MRVDNSGNKVLSETPYGEFTYSFDVGNRLKSLTNHKNESFSFDYDDGNRLLKITRPGSETLFSFNQTNFLEQILHKQTVDGNVLSKFDYVKDAIGNRAEKHTLSASDIYGYNSNNQIISVQDRDQKFLESFGYDAIGNRTHDILQNYTYDEKRQRITEDSLYFYYHDNNGNLTAKHSKVSDEVIQYIYSSENQLVQLKWYTGSNLIKEAKYSFDALGRRIQKKITNHEDSSRSFTRRFVFDDNAVLAQQDENNNLLAIYTHSSMRIDDVLAIDVIINGVSSGIGKSKGTFLYLKDGLGSITEIVTLDGDLKQHLKYSIFGKISSIKDNFSQDTMNDPFLAPYFTYTNREFDTESSLYFFRARTYSPELGRFLQTDPFPGNVKYPASIINRYNYTFQNPIDFTDPTGESLFGGAFKVFGDFSNEHMSIRTQKYVGVIIGAAIVTAGFVSANPVLVGTGTGVIYGSTSAAEGESPFAKAAQFGIIGGVSSYLVLTTVGAAAPGTFTVFETLALSSGVGYAGGAATGSFIVGADPGEAGTFGAIVGFGTTALPKGPQKFNMLNNSKGAHSAYPKGSTVSGGSGGNKTVPMH